ncbi:MAG: hypothetical protein ABSE99_00865 [Terracidiphilus sp.]|jgi:hypothetical protein
MRALWLALALGALPVTLCAQSDPVFQVDYSNPGLTPSHWVLTLHPDGSGHFRSERGNAPVESPQTLDAPNVDRDIRLSAGFAEQVFQTARRHRLFAVECDSHMKVAFQGRKKLSYAGPEGQGSCEFNYSKDKEIQALGDSLIAVAGTILEGARLEMLLQHDRLGLDKEMEFLVEAAGDGRVRQICAIRSILERLAEDPGVMERVRKRARALLARTDG